MHTEIILADSSQMPVIQNLVSLYIYDLSEVMGWRCPENGLFAGCDDLPQYWGRDPDSIARKWPEHWKGYPYLLRKQNELAGFALIKQIGDPGSVMYEVGGFFILRKFRRSGVGRQVAHLLFDMFRGDWQIRQLLNNAPAQRFWRNVVCSYTNGNYRDSTEFFEKGGRTMVVQRFRNA